jgi:hypothetical protein
MTKTTLLVRLHTGDPRADTDRWFYINTKANESMAEIANDIKLALWRYTVIEVTPTDPCDVRIEGFDPADVNTRTTPWPLWRFAN